MNNMDRQTDVPTKNFIIHKPCSVFTLAEDTKPFLRTCFEERKRGLHVNSSTFFLFKPFRGLSGFTTGIALLVTSGTV